jgi:hypothetical protein
MQVFLQKVIRFVRKSPRQLLLSPRWFVPRQLRSARTAVLEQLQATRATVRYRLEARGWELDYLGNDRTTYIIGLMGTGRWYVNELILQNIGKRAIYFKQGIRCHPGPTSMIYSGHATMRYVSLGQHLPAVTMRILEAVRSGYADLIFIYRHPLDSLLTTWIWWRKFIRYDLMSGITSDVYKNNDDLCAELEQNFVEFKAFAEGDPAFFAALRGPRLVPLPAPDFGTLPNPRFLSFSEFVEETALFLQSATLTLRLEDFVIDPFKEFSKIAKVMSVDLDSSGLRIARPRSKPYRYLAVKENSPQFRKFIIGLDVETRRRIEKIGYSVG